MSTQATLASVDILIDREDTVSRHHNRDHFEKLNFWRDILPGALSIRLPDSNGDWLSESLHQASLCHPGQKATFTASTARC